MRNKFFSRKLRSILSVALSLVMLIGTCLVVPTTAMAVGETITIDFERNVSDAGSGLLGIINTTGADGQSTKAFKVMGHDTASAQYRSRNIKDASGAQYTLTPGDYTMTYDYYVTEGSTVKAYLIHNFGITTGNLIQGDSGVFCSGVKLLEENLVASYETGTWKSNTISFTLSKDVTNLGFAGLGTAGEKKDKVIHIDNVVFTKLENVSAYAEDHNTFSEFKPVESSSGLRNTMNVTDGQSASGQSFVYNYQNLLSQPATYNGDSALALCLWSGARHIRMNDTYQGLALRAGKKYTLTFNWVNPNPEKEGVIGNGSINNGTSAYDNGAYISLIANAGGFGGTGYTTLATLLDVNDFSSAEGNTGEFVTKTVTFSTPYGVDITDIAISGKSTNGPAYDAANKFNDYILLDDFRFTCEDIPFEPITIDFEKESLVGSTYFGIDSVDGANGASTKAFRAKYVAEDERFSQFRKDSKNIGLEKGIYKFEYSYFISSTATENLSNSNFKFAETTGLVSPWENGTAIGKNIIVPGSQKGVWIKSSQYISLTEHLTALGIFATKTPTNVYLDDIRITKVEGFVTLCYSDGSVELVDYTDNLTLPEDNALNFSHWVDSKGNIVQVGDPAVNYETYTAVVNDKDKIIYDFTDFKETDAAKKTEDGIRVEVEPLTETNVVVPIETDSGKKIALNKNSGYLVRANYKSMSVAGEDGSGAAGYVAEWWNPEKPISAKKGNFPEIRISISSAGYATGGIALQDTVDYVTTKWTYIETGNSEHSLKLSFSAKKANLSEVYVKSIEIVPFDLSATQADENVINTTVEMFYNGTNDNVTINTSNKNSNIFGLEMPAMSAVYNYKDTQRSLMRFVTNYAYANGDITQLKVSDELSLPIEKRRILVGKEESRTDDYGIIVEDDRKFAKSTPERAVENDKSCWKIDTENGVISHSLMLKNIKKENKDNIYEIQSYLLLDVVDGRKYSPWIAFSGNFNYLRFVETKAQVTAQNVYDALSATANIAWYE